MKDDEYCEGCPLKLCAKIDLKNESAILFNPRVLGCCQIKAKMDEIIQDAIMELKDEQNKPRTMKLCPKINE